MIAIVDYDVGNIKSVLFAMRRIGAEARLTSDPDKLADADGIILPGVGAFSAAIAGLESRGLRKVLVQEAKSEKPFLGICVGHQLLFSESEERGRHTGLDLIPGRVRRFSGRLKTPHMGWNKTYQKKQSPLFEGIEKGAFFYFAHSYYAVPADKTATLSTTDYGIEFSSAVQHKQIYGVQFHPEKSGEQGLKLLRNFRQCCGEKSAV